MSFPVNTGVKVEETGSRITLLTVESSTDGDSPKGRIDENGKTGENSTNKSPGFRGKQGENYEIQSGIGFLFQFIPC